MGTGLLSAIRMRGQGRMPLIGNKALNALESVMKRERLQRQTSINGDIISSFQSVRELLSVLIGKRLRRIRYGMV